MAQIFVFTAGNSEAKQHLARSIESSIDEETVFGRFASSYREKLSHVREMGHGFYAWGAIPGLRNLPTWEAMERGDYILCVYNGTYHYVARVIAKHENRQFAKRVKVDEANLAHVLSGRRKTSRGMLAKLEFALALPS
jgi:hypothetical protein